MPRNTLRAVLCALNVLLTRGGTNVSEKRTIYIVDDDPYVIKIVALLLRNAGYDVKHNTSSPEAYREICLSPPDVVLTDIMMPEMDGIALCKRLREHPELQATPIVVLTAKTYDFDKRRAFRFGANGYIQKPINPDTFIDQLESVIKMGITLSFWGVRGTLPVPGEGSLRYGGNTVCVTLSLPKERFFIFDAGTGIKALSNHLIAHHKGNVIAKIFISHPHWDHINALPFFVPLYIQGNEIEICGPSHGDVRMRDLISAQMDDVYFPITMKEFAARVYFRDLQEGIYDIDGVEVKTMLLTHPGNCLGYRINYKHRSICYVTDQELYPRSSPSYNPLYREQLQEFVKDTDVLITDCTYFDEEYPSKEGWGHSSVSEVVHLSHLANVKRLFIYHHDPDHADDDIDRMVAQARTILNDLQSSTECQAAREQESLLL